MSPPGLLYYPDDRPGIRRKRQGRGFSYLAPDGTRIDRGSERKRIDALAVPPAYDDVWISPKPNGHLQATGRDTRARKQYRYHPDWTEWRAQKKYDDLATFGAALPRIRRAIRAGLKEETGDREFALAAVLALIDRASIRVGNAEYTERNGSRGAVTLTGRHVDFEDGEIRLSYTAKGGKKVRKRLRDRTLLRALDRLADLPGGTLFTWQDDDGTLRDVGPEQINRHLSELAGQDGITAKTFRTWAGTEAALAVALDAEDLTIKAMAEAAAERLANTPTIARNSYIHPAVIDLAEVPAQDRLALTRDLPETADLRRAERALLRLIS